MSSLDHARASSSIAQSVLSGQVTRRGVLRQVAALSFGVPVLSALLAACGGSDSEVPAAPGDTSSGQTVTSDTSSSSATPANTTPEQSGAANGAAVIRVAIAGDWKTLDPIFYTNVSERQIFYSIFSPLVEMNEDLEIVPCLVKSWEFEDDGRSLTFHLESGVVFHDGTPFDANAVKFNLDRLLAPETGSPQRSNVDAITTVEVIDPQTVKLELKEPFTPLLGSLTEGPGFMSSPAAIQKYGNEYGQHPVGTGPFKLVDWVKGDQITLERFEQYWRDGFPRVAKVVWKPIPDDTVKMANLQTGEVDIVDSVPPKDHAMVKANPQFGYWEAQGTRWPMIRLNVAKEPFTNKAARQAVAYAINRDEIIKAVYFGAAIPAFGPISPIYKSYYDPAVEQYGFSHDISKARAKLAEAGLDRLAFTLEISNNPTQQRMAEIIKRQLSEAGIDMDIQVYESTAFQDRITNKQYQAVLGSWTPRPDIDGTMYRHFASDGNVNSMSYSNPQVDDLLKRTRVLPAGPERVQAYRDVQKLIVDDCPWVFLVFETQLVAWQKRVTNLPHIPDMMLRLERVQVED